MNKTVRPNMPHAFAAKQRGMVLLVSLVFLLLLTLLGISSMQNATLQEKMAGSVMVRNQSFQMAEAALRLGESEIKKAGFSMAVC
ncbi:pilus assembly PilX family protein, partial [Pseudomonas syringae]